jgi:cell division septation protein DedD
VRRHWYFAVERGTISAGLTSHPTDDGFHEIQLNGKQLVFLFMAATVVSVVIFLCGVLVGRGVRAERGAVAMADVPAADQIAPTGTTSTLETTALHTASAPPAAVDERPSLFERLEKDPGLDELKTPASKPAQAPAAPPVSIPRTAPVAVSAPPPSPKPASAPPPKQAPAPAASTPASRPATPPASGAKSGYVVQLAALNSRGEADAMVKRLNAKGYEAFVQVPAENAPAIFRVRVGNYPTRGEAETVAARLQKEGQFKPWVAAR